MAVRKLKETRSPELVRQDSRAALARKADPKWDRSGTYFQLCAELAESLELDVASVFEEFRERSAVRHYCGATSIEDAERGAWADVEYRFRKQGELI